VKRVPNDHCEGKRRRGRQRQEKTGRKRGESASPEEDVGEGREVKMKYETIWKKKTYLDVSEGFETRRVNEEGIRGKRDTNCQTNLRSVLTTFKREEKCVSGF